MKNVFFSLMIIGFALLSCRSDEEGVQRIDQLIQIYIDSAGQDMLNTNISGGYSNLRMNDVNGFTDSAPVSFNIKKNKDTVSYMEYIAGARRIGIDSSGTSKTYESKIALFYNKRINDSTLTINNDTLIVHYTSTPTIFQVSKIWYNNELKFTKVEGQENIVEIQK